MGEILFYYLSFINVVTFLVYGMDKLAAKMDRWRVPERVLLGLAVIGGSVGAFAGMQTFRHKTRKAKFYIGVPFILAMQLLLILGVKYYL